MKKEIKQMIFAIFLIALSGIFVAQKLNDLRPWALESNTNSMIVTICTFAFGLLIVKPIVIFLTKILIH